MSIQLPAIGTTLVGKYELAEVLGEGGFARVYRATDATVGRDVAIKILKPADDESTDRRGHRFLREMRIIANLRGRHIVRMFDFGRTDDGLMYMVLELLGGSDLDALAGDGPMSERDVVHVLGQLLEALGEAHTLGLLHRDIKPANIRVYEYMDDPLCVKLLDFGIARAADEDVALTATGKAVGTPRFMAPEQFLGEPLTPATDLYSLGLVAFELLTGRPSDHMRAVANHEAVELTADDGVGEPLRGVVNRMLAREPRRRFQSASAVAQALAQPPASTTDETPAAPLPDAHRPAGSSRSPVLLKAGGIALGVVVVGLAVLTARTPERSPPVRPPARVSTLIKGHAPPEPPVLEQTPDAAPDLDPRTDGCGAPAPFSGTGNLRAGRIEWAVHLPPSYDPERRHPVVMLFHDDASSGSGALRDTALAGTADAHGFVIIAPNDEDLAFVWNSSDDLGVATLALQESAARLCLDTEMVVAIGYGSGGQAAAQLSCTELVRGVVFAAYMRETPEFPCQPERPVAAMFLGATKTRHHPVEGGHSCTGTPKISYDTYEGMWRERNHCTTTVRRFARHGASVCRQWECGATPFVACRVDGGRGWPGSPERAIDLLRCDGTPPDFPQNEVIWQFIDSLR